MVLDTHNPGFKCLYFKDYTEKRYYYLKPLFCSRQPIILTTSTALTVYMGSG